VNNPRRRMNVTAAEQRQWSVQCLQSSII